MRRAAILLLAPMLVGATPPPMRIVSLNPCVDAILRAVAPPERIVAISAYSQDPAATSVPIAWARRFRAIRGTAEEVIALRPDLVIVSRHTDLATRAALGHAGLRVMLVDVPASVEESLMQVDTVARAVGEPVAGARLRGAIVRAVDAARPVQGAMPIPAVIYQAGGLVPGRGTLADDLLRRAGFSNASGWYKLRTWDVLPLEPLVARPPRVVFSTIDAGPANGGFGDATRTMRARALAMLGRRVLVADYPASLLHCAGPTIIRASATLAAARRRVAS